MPELQRLRADHSPAVLAFERANRAYFAAVISDRGDDYFDRFDEGFDALLADQEAGGGAYHVLLAEDGSVLGRFNLIFTEDGTAELGYRVAESAAGRGVATETVRQLCQVAAARYGLHTLRAATSHQNVASQKVLTNTGFVPVGPANPRDIGGKTGTWFELVLAAPRLSPVADRLIFQLGTNNWQRDGEFAPGSGILHESHHRAYNALPGVRCYSMYPSRRQRFTEELVHVFPLEHDIPICESVSPVSSYRWHSMSETEVDAYRLRLTNAVAEWMDDIEARTGDTFSLAIAHHAFMNTVVLRDVNRRRVATGRPRMTVMCFAHGTELKMFNHERLGDSPDEFPLRFYPFMQREKIFDFADPSHGVDVAAAISSEQVDALVDVFPSFPRDRVVLSPNGYNQDVFQPLPDGTDRAAVLAGFSTQPLSGSGLSPEPIAPADGFDAVVAFCGKFADWKRLDALLRAAAIYEQDARRIVTLVIGSGPPEAQRAMHELTTELGLRRTYFLGAREQDELATLFGCADVGCFPSYREPFGLVFVECMACATPVIGADSGGPRDFVTPAVGTLVPETDDRAELAASLAQAIGQSLDEDWKKSRGPVAARYARDRFSVTGQVTHLLEEVDRLTG